MINKAEDLSVMLQAKQGSVMEMTGGSDNHFVSFLNTHDEDKMEKTARDRYQLNEYGDRAGVDYDPRRRTLQEFNKEVSEIV